VVSSQHLTGPLGTHNMGRVRYEDQALLLLTCPKYGVELKEPWFRRST
jgi:hypothetical protein